MAYDRLEKAKWMGEQVDVFANEIRRLVRLAGYRDTVLEQTMKLAFVIGCPDHVYIGSTEAAEHSLHGNRRSNILG